jgi:hypothetical protein
MTDKTRTIEGENLEGQTVKVLLKTPDAGDYRDSQVEYNKAFRKALDSGALLRQKLDDHMKEQGIWSDEKQEKNDEYVNSIQKMEEALQGGGIKLTEAKDIAIKLRTVRIQFRDFLAEKNNLDQNSVEGQADNARFSELVRLCMLNPATKKPYFPTQADYDSAADQPWVIKAASELAGILYGLDPDYDQKLTENKFLKEFDFVNEELSLINKNGHTVDIDGRLIDEFGRFVAYRTKDAEIAKDEEQRYFCNRDGEEVIKVTEDDGDETWVKKSLATRQPFLDDDGNPIITAKKEDAEKEEDLVAAEAAPTEQKSRKTRKKTAEEKRTSS